MSRRKPPDRKMPGDESDHDARAFRDAMRDAQPLANDRADVAVPKPRPKATFTRRGSREVLDESLRGNPDPGLLGTGDELFYARVELPRTVLRKLKRGQYAVEGEIDLHGLTAVQARDALHEFLRECKQRRWRCVRVVHGKGKRSGHLGPVLKPKVARWLRQRDDVHAYSSARPADGGSGALYVLLD